LWWRVEPRLGWRIYAGIRVLVQDLGVRVVDAATGELLRELVVDTSPDYQPTGAPKGRARPKKT
jgi:hypothetical protein